MLCSYIRYLTAVANFGVILVFNKLCCGVICILHVSLTDAAMCMNLINESLFSIVISLSYFLVIAIFYCAYITASHIPDWNFRKAVYRLNLVAKWVAA